MTGLNAGPLYEGGQLVTAALFGVELPDRPMLQQVGHTSQDVLLEEFGDMPILVALRILLAGRLVLGMYAGRSDPEFLEEQQVQWAVKSAMKAYEQTEEGAMNLIGDLCEELEESILKGPNWTAVTQVARKLQENGTISGQEVREIIGANARPVPPSTST